MKPFLLTVNRVHKVLTEAHSSLSIIQVVGDHVPEAERVSVEPFNGTGRPMPLGDAIRWLQGAVCGN